MTCLSHSNLTSAGFDHGDLPRPGRPRDDGREQAILDAALELVAEVGLDRMSMDAVAARAKASKATIYRRWPGKTELLVAAVKRRVAPVEQLPADTGSLRGDLIAVMQSMCADMAGQDGALMCGLAFAIHNDPALGQALGDTVHDAKVRVATVVVDRAKARHEVPESADPTLMFDLASGVILSQQLRGQPLDAALIDRLVDRVLIPLLDAPDVSSRNPR